MPPKFNTRRIASITAFRFEARDSCKRYYTTDIKNHRILWGVVVSVV
jgi:hypothetical protein